jgi:hypothetical protein
MRTLPALAISAALLLACGCGFGGGGGGGGTVDDRGSAPLVSYARSGGIASLPERLVVEADGSTALVAGVEGAQTTFRLSPERLEQLRSGLEAADFDAVEQPPGPTMCADCFSYELIYDGATITYDEADLLPASVTSVVALLAQITSEHYPSDAVQRPAS